MATDTFVIMRTGLFLLLLVSAGMAGAQQPDTVHVPAGGWYSYIVGVHSKKGVYSGHVEYFDSTWTLRQRGFARKGRWDGLLESFDSAGTLRQKSFVEKGKWEGMITTYRSNGRVWSEVPYHKGKANGMSKVYHANGALGAAGTYKDGKQFGEQLFWDTAGAAANGDIVYDLPGSDTVQIHCVDGRPEGKMVRKRADGSFYAIGTYSEGLPEAFIYYDRNGTPVRKYLFEQGRFVKSVPLNQYP